MTFYLKCARLAFVNWLDKLANIAHSKAEEKVNIVIGITKATFKEAAETKKAFPGNFNPDVKNLKNIQGTIDMKLPDGRDIPSNIILNLLEGFLRECNELHKEALTNPLYKPISDLGLSASCVDELHGANVKFLGQLAILDGRDLCARGLGIASLEEAGIALRRHNLEFNSKIADFLNFEKIMQILSW